MISTLCLTRIVGEDTFLVEETMCNYKKNPTLVFLALFYMKH